MRSVFLEGQEPPKGHYSPAIVHEGVVYVSGQLPIGNDGVAVTGNIEEQVRLCMKNVESILHAAGSRLDLILKVNIFLSDVALWPAVNKAYADVMGSHKPARIVVPCGKLHYGCDIEIDCIAAVAP